MIDNRVCPSVHRPSRDVQVPVPSGPRCSNSLSAVSRRSVERPFLVIAANIPHCGAMVFQRLVEVLHHVAPAFLRHRRDRNTHNLAVVLRIEPQVRRAQRLLDIRQDAGIPGLDQDQVGIGSGHLRHLVERRIAAVVRHLDLVEHVYRRPAGACGRQVSAKIIHRFLHPRLELLLDIFEGGDTGHYRDCHRRLPRSFRFM